MLSPLLGGDVENMNISVSPPPRAGHTGSMTKQSTAVARLFTEEELSGIQATGSAWVATPDDPATVPVPLQTVIVDVKGPYTERDRKLWVFLLHAVFDELGHKAMHEISVADVNAVFRELGGRHETRWLWDSVRRLARTVVEWETLGDDRMEIEEWGVATLLYANLTKNARSTGRLKFGFPPNLIPIIQHPRRFARLRLHFLMSLSGKYAVTMYEVLEGFSNRDDGTCRVTIEELRRWLKVPEGSYQNWKDLRKWVIDPAISQINDDPVASGFSVIYEPVRKGRFYHEIIFKMTKSPDRIRHESRIRQAKKRGERVRDLKAKGRPYLSPEAINKAAHETRHELDMGEIERQFWEHYERKGEELSNVAHAFMNFTKKKYGQAKYGKP